MRDNNETYLGNFRQYFGLFEHEIFECLQPDVCTVPQVRQVQHGSHGSGRCHLDIFSVKVCNNKERKQEILKVVRASQSSPDCICSSIFAFNVTRSVMMADISNFSSGKSSSSVSTCCSFSSIWLKEQ